MNGNYPYGMLALELEEGLLAGHKWKYRSSAVYEIIEKDADEFDNSFIKKEKGYRYTQEIFSIAFRSYFKQSSLNNHLNQTPGTSPVAG